LWIMEEQLLNNSILDQFVHSHEQSYEEFLNTFTYLLKGSFILPGEVEQTVTCCTLSFDQPVQQKFRTLPVIQASGSQTQELLGDDVQPFSLDEEFDYDNVPLTPKFSEADLKALTDLSEEKK
ncbi:Uncharacterized protein C11orf74, partial [Tinamus guttatus]